MSERIKISRGEENIFIWCMFMAICERVIDGHPSYHWVKHLYIDDPVSSLDDNNAIAMACDLSALLRNAATRQDVTRGARSAQDGLLLSPRVVLQCHVQRA